MKAKKSHLCWDLFNDSWDVETWYYRYLFHAYIRTICFNLIRRIQ